MTVESTEPLVAEFLQTFAEMREASRKIEAEVGQAVLTQQPPTCDRHAVRLSWDVDASCRATARNRTLTLEATPCEICRRHSLLTEDDRWLIDRGVPESLAGCSFGNFRATTHEERTALDACREFVRPTGRKSTLLLAGNLGTGKTHLAISILRATRHGWFAEVKPMIEEHRRTYDARDRDARSPVNKLKRATLLILDEFRLPKGADVEEIIDTVLMHRVNNRIKTVITFNGDLPALLEMVGPRLADRLPETFHAIKYLTGESKRA